MLRQYVSLVGITLIIILFSGCLSSCDHTFSQVSAPVAESEYKDNSIIEIPEHLSIQLEEKLSIDADISFDSIAPYRTYNAEVLHLDLDAVSNLLSEQDPIIEGGNVFESDTAFTYNAWTSSGGTLTFESSSYYLSVNYISGWFNDVSPLLKIYDKESTVNWADYDNRDMLLHEVDLSFLSIDEALADVTNILQPLGIQVNKRAEVYSLNAEVLQALADSYTERPKHDSDSIKTEWTYDDECYYMILRYECDTIPINTHTLGLTFGSNVTVCYNKDGIQFLRIDQPYSILGIEEESGSILSMDELQAIIKKKYDSIILTDPVIITAIEFCYTATLQSDDEYFLEPTWLIEVQQSVGDDVLYSYVGFNAVTGKEL